MVSLICYSKRMKNSLQVNDCVKVKIDAVAFGGEGVGRVKNVVVFVAFSAPGDELEIKIVQVKKRFARGKILKIIRHSPWRTSPLCKYYERCGGCCYQHIDYEYQLQIKKKQVQDIFCKIGKINNPPVLDTVASPQKYHYRGKAQLHTEVSSHGVKMGFWIYPAVRSWISDIAKSWKKRLTNKSKCCVKEKI